MSSPIHLHPAAGLAEALQSVLSECVTQNLRPVYVNATWSPSRQRFELSFQVTDRAGFDRSKRQFAPSSELSWYGGEEGRDACSVTGTWFGLSVQVYISATNYHRSAS